MEEIKQNSKSFIACRIEHATSNLNCRDWHVKTIVVIRYKSYLAELRLYSSVFKGFIDLKE